MEQAIRAMFEEVFKETGGESMPDLHAGTVLLSSGLDSLGFAILVVKLEERLGFDPFSASAEAFYPRTFGEFVAFYERNAPGR